MRALNPCLRAFALAVPMALVACGGEDGGTPTGESKNEFSFETGEFEVPAGDTQTCFYLDTFTDRELAVVGAHGQQGTGGHHIIIYYSDEPREPGQHLCSDTEMVSLKQIIGSSGQDATAAEGAVLGFPEGLAMKVPAGKQLVIQAHYINTTGEPMRVNDKVTMELGDPEDVVAYVNYLALPDLNFKVPPQADYTHTTECTLERDFDIALSLGHMHEQGKHFKLEVLGEGDSPRVIRDDEWNELYVSHPPIDSFSVDAPMKLKKGTTLRQTCTWNNTTPDQMMFPTEMCVGFFYYFPAEGDVECNMKEVEAE